MGMVFMKILNMSIAASWVVLVVVLLRQLLKRVPRWFHCALWIMVAVRLVCPISFESTFSLIPEQISSGEVAAEISDDYVGTTRVFWDNTEEYEAAVAAGREPISGGEGHTYVVTGKDQRSAPATVETELVPIIGMIWAVGIGAMAIYAVGSYYRLRKRVAASISLTENLYLCDYIESPFILGIISPKIYLPSTMDPNAAAHVLAHERAHIKRRDHWWKPLGFVLLTLHWFNPVMWLAYVLLCRDIELACDEKVIREMEPVDRKDYSEALLSCSVPRYMIAACPLAFGEVGVKQRVKSVLNYKKPAFWVIVVAIVICIVVAVCFLTDPVTETSLAAFRDISENDITCVDLWSVKGGVCLSTRKEIAEAMEVLSSTQYDPEPVSEEVIENTVDEYGWAYSSMVITCGEREETIYFDEDYAIMWGANEEETTVPYRVEDPALLRSLFETQISIAGNSQVNAEPFATADQPWQWTQNICYDAVEKVQVWTNEDGNHGYFMSRVRFEEFLDVLNQIPQNVITQGSVTGGTYSELFYKFSGKGTSVVVADAANQLVVIIRYYEDTTEMILCDDYEKAMEGHYKVSNLQVWNIDDPQLLDCMKEIYEHWPQVSTFIGSEYEWERIPVTVSGKDASITMRMIQDWEYEVVEYAEGSESFGIRCRPEQVSEGWIYFSFWPEGYDPIEEDRYLHEFEDEMGTTTYSYPAEVYSGNTLDMTGVIWSYRRVRTEKGDYAVIPENAESWAKEYWGAIDDLSIITEYTITGTDVSYSYDYANMAFTLPYGWEYETVGYTDDEMPFGIRFRRKYLDGWISLQYWPGDFAVCGTGLVTEDIQLENGLTATVGYYDGKEVWSYICVNGLPGDYVMQNEGADAWLLAYETELMDLLGQAVLAEGIIDESQAKELALGYAVETGWFEDIYGGEQGITYESRFNYEKGIWNITLRKQGDAPMDVQLDAEGNVIE